MPKYNLLGLANDAPISDDMPPSIPKPPTLLYDKTDVGISKKFHDRSVFNMPRWITEYSGKRGASCCAIQILLKGRSGI